MTKLIIILIIVVFISIFFWAINAQLKQSQKDWETLDYLKKRSNEVETKEEIEEFHKEFVEKSNKIYNSLIKLELSKIDGYLRGLYKHFK